MRERRPRSQTPVFHAVKRFRHGRREAWRTVTWQKHDTYTVDGSDRVFDDPVEAIRVAEETRVLARRTSDGRALNYYYANEEM